MFSSEMENSTAGEFEPSPSLLSARGLNQPMPTTKLTLVVPLPPMFNVWTFFAPSI
jgi:hypothetical protein